MRRQTLLASFTLIFTLLGLSALSHATLPLVDSQGKPLPSLAPMLERTLPAVVNIASSGHVRVQESPLFSDPFFRHFFDIPDQQPQERRTQALGSGVIVDADKGYILTNNHVIDKADAITVTLKDGRNFKAKLIGTDPETDIAVVQIKAKGLTAVKLGNSDRLRVGDFAVAIGNPFGLGQTVTSGIISALGRSGLGIEGYEDFIQTDASINPGNSGGALVDLAGELIGINTAIFSRSGGNIGIGFAIPINMAHEIMTQLIAHGEIKRGQLGAQAQNLTPDLVQAFGLPNGRAGAVVTKVTPNSAADKAGLKAGDIVTEISGRPVRDASDLRNYIGVLRVGEHITMKILRDGKPQTLSAVVEEPETTQAAGKAINPQLEGADFTDITQGNPLYGQIEGVLVAEVDPGSPAWRAGLRKGDVIVLANRKKIKGLSDLEKAVKGHRSLLLNIQRGNLALFLYLQ